MSEAHNLHYAYPIHPVQPAQRVEQEGIATHQQLSLLEVNQDPPTQNQSLGPIARHVAKVMPDQQSRLTRNLDTAQQILLLNPALYLLALQLLKQVVG